MTRRSVPTLFLVPFFVFGCKSRSNNEQTEVKQALPPPKAAPVETETVKCDVIIAGGTTAATAAALSASKEFERQGIKGRACLLEPTNWPGGQLTSSGVAAVDFDHHTGEKYGFARDGKSFNIGTYAANQSNVFRSWMTTLGLFPETDVLTMKANPARCWVSVRCFEPRKMVGLIKAAFKPYEDKGFLKVWYNTVPKSVSKTDKRITSISAIQRFRKDAKDSLKTIPHDQEIYDLALSSVLEDWYSPADSSRFKKKGLRFETSDGNAVVIDATEWGEVLALSDAAYKQGLEGLPKGKDTCGQAIVYPLALTLADKPVDLPDWYKQAYTNAIPQRAFDLYSHKGGGGTWDENWRYRRMKATSGGGEWSTPPAIGDITQINVLHGNDYEFEYLFVPKEVARAQVRDGKWSGGVDHSVLKNAEIHALGYLPFLRTTPADKDAALYPKLEASDFQKQDGSKDGNAISLTKRIKPSDAYGTANGLSKVPYIRDTRRSVGVDFESDKPYQINYEVEFVDGTRPADTIAIGVYAADQHPVKGCQLPDPTNPYPRPAYLPLRALTNISFENLLVAGKTMAQDFLTNAATRLHPIEFASGTAAGVLAVAMGGKPATKPDPLESESDPTDGATAASTPKPQARALTFTSEVVYRVKEHHGPVEWKTK